MRTFVVIIILFGVSLLLIDHFIIKESTVTISDYKDIEIDSLRDELQYYKNREKMFLKNNSELYKKVSELEQQLDRKPVPVYIKPNKNEKNPLISASESEYFNDLLSRRYQDKP